MASPSLVFARLFTRSHEKSQETLLEMEPVNGPKLVLIIIARGYPLRKEKNGETPEFSKA
jgi:hypothetical protein